MIVLGIDPAIRTTGYGVISAEAAGCFKVLDCGVIANTQRMRHSECVRRLAGGIRELAARFRPDCASIEDPFVGRNAATAIILGMARGAILAALAEAEIPVFSYAPSVAKRSAVGSGKASKEQVAALIAAETGIDAAGIKLDCTDALALAVCHAQRVLHPGMRTVLPPRL